MFKLKQNIWLSGIQAVPNVFSVNWFIHQHQIFKKILVKVCMDHYIMSLEQLIKSKGMPWWEIICSLWFGKWRRL